MKGLSEETAVYLYRGTVDMRCGFDRLSALVQEKHGRAVFSGGVYLFFSRCRGKVKLLYWDRDGFAMWHKRLEAGCYRVEKKDESEQITVLDMEEILSGTEYSRIKFRKSVENGSFSAA